MGLFFAANYIKLLAQDSKNAGNDWLKAKRHDYLTQWPVESQLFPGITALSLPPGKLRFTRQLRYFINLR
jgi:hypothetical protein